MLVDDGPEPGGYLVDGIVPGDAFEPTLAWLVLSENLQTYQSIVLNRYYRVNANCLVAGALTGYLPLSLGIVAAGSAITAIQRVAMAYREMAQLDAAAQGEKT